MTNVLIRREEETQTETHRENIMWQQRQEWEWLPIYRPRNTQDCGQHRKLKDRHETDSFPQTSERAWPCQHFDFGLLASSTKRINPYCIKPPSLWDFVSVALGNKGARCMRSTWILVNERLDHFSISAQGHSQSPLLRQSVLLNKKKGA